MILDLWWYHAHNMNHICISPQGRIHMNHNVSLPKPYADKLKAERLKTGLTSSELIRRALDLYFKEKERGNA